MNRVVASQLTTIEQVAQLVLPPADGHFRPLTEHSDHVYICYESRLLPWRRRPINETYNFRLTDNGLFLTTYRRNGPIARPQMTLTPYHQVDSVKFYFGEARVRFCFSADAKIGSHFLPAQRKSRNPFARRRQFLYMNFVVEAERVRLLTTLVECRLVDFARSPTARRGGFSVAFHPRIVSVRYEGGVPLSDRFNLWEDIEDEEDEVNNFVDGH